MQPFRDVPTRPEPLRTLAYCAFAHTCVSTQVKKVSCSSLRSPAEVRLCKGARRGEPRLPDCFFTHVWAGRAATCQRQGFVDCTHRRLRVAHTCLFCRSKETHRSTVTGSTHMCDHVWVLLQQRHVHTTAVSNTCLPHVARLVLHFCATVAHT